jgi:hypothetical protein
MRTAPAYLRCRGLHHNRCAHWYRLELLTATATASSRRVLLLLLLTAARCLLLVLLLSQPRLLCKHRRHALPLLLDGT